VRACFAWQQKRTSRLNDLNLEGFPKVAHGCDFDYVGTS